MPDLTDFIDRKIHVSYQHPDADAIAFQVDGKLIALTPDALEAQCLIVLEDAGEWEGVEFDQEYRAIPLGWVTNITPQAVNT